MESDAKIIVDTLLLKNRRNKLLGQVSVQLQVIGQVWILYCREHFFAPYLTELFHELLICFFGSESDCICETRTDPEQGCITGIAERFQVLLFNGSVNIGDFSKIRTQFSLNVF